MVKDRVLRQLGIALVVLAVTLVSSGGFPAIGGTPSPEGAALNAVMTGGVGGTAEISPTGCKVVITITISCDEGDCSIEITVELVCD